MLNEVNGGFSKDGGIDLKKNVFTSKIGIWYTPWWDKSQVNKRAENWDMVRYRALCTDKLIAKDYDADEEDVVNAQLTMMADCGINFILFDLTNGVWGIMKPNIEMIRSDNRLEVAFATQYRPDLADWIYENVVDRGNYFNFRGKPLLVHYQGYNDKGDQTEGAFWTDERFHMEHACGTCTPDNPLIDFEKQGYNWDSWWGWYTKEPSPSKTAMSIIPGFNTKKNYQGGNYTAREDGGMLYIRQWLKCIKNNPEVISIACWNDFNEECHIEPCITIERTNTNHDFQGQGSVGHLWLDINGNTSPFLYVRITKAYSALRNGILLNGCYYRYEEENEIFLVKDGQKIFTEQSAVKAGYPVIILPNNIM